MNPVQAMQGSYWRGDMPPTVNAKHVRTSSYLRWIFPALISLHTFPLSRHADIFMFITWLPYAKYMGYGIVIVKAEVLSTKEGAYCTREVIT